MKILVAGSSGLVGTALVGFLRGEQHTVVRLLRSISGLSDDVVAWNADSGEINLQDIEGFDAVINLAGENIASGTWTEEKKKRILESRARSTQNLCHALAQLKNPPKVLVNASAVGFYGNRGDHALSEESHGGEGFLPKVCHEWEKATTEAESKGIRVVKLRIGVVLTPKGGALKRMLAPFKLGLGGVVGPGTQYMSWIAIDDLVQVFSHVLEKNVQGPINAVSPNPVTNRTFTKTLGKVLKRPTIFPLPAFIARAILGKELANELLLSSTRAVPKVLQSSGYTFKYPDLKAALQHLLG